MRAGGKVDCNAVVCVADGMCAEETCGSGSGGEAHRVRWPAAISPMRPLQSASFVASQRQTSCWCSERTGARTVKTRKRAFMSSVKSPWGECLAPGGFHRRASATHTPHSRSTTAQVEAYRPRSRPGLPKRAGSGPHARTSPHARTPRSTRVRGRFRRTPTQLAAGALPTSAPSLCARKRTRRAPRPARRLAPPR